MVKYSPLSFSHLLQKSPDPRNKSEDDKLKFCKFKYGGWYKILEAGYSISTQRKNLIPRRSHAQTVFKLSR